MPRGESGPLRRGLWSPEGPVCGKTFLARIPPQKMLCSAAGMAKWPGFPSLMARIPLLQHIYIYIQGVALE